MKGSIKLGKIFGIDISIHYTLLLALVLFTWLLGSSYFPQQVKGAVTYQYWIAGFLATFLLFTSVLVHELAHSLVAKAKGLPVSSITLFILGGVSNLSEEPGQPGTEFQMAIAGPVMSLVLAGFFWGIACGFGNRNDLTASIIGYMAITNLLLAAFNLLPGFPLDGGRVLRSIVWRASHNLLKATNIASFIGRVFGWGLMGLGVYLGFFQANWFNGVWLIFIGWFLNSAADNSRYEVTLKEHLTGVKVEKVMDRTPLTIPPQMAVSDLVQSVFIQKRKRAIPVANGENLLGMVTIADVRGLTQDKWAQTTVAQIMHRQPIYTVKPEDDLAMALRVIAQYDLNQVPVLSGDKLVGIITRADILNYLQLSQDLKINDPDRFKPVKK